MLEKWLETAKTDFYTSGYKFMKKKHHITTYIMQFHVYAFIFRLFTFPSRKKNVEQREQRERWKQLISRKDGTKLWSPSKDSRVCSIHFVEGQPTLQNPLPTLKLGYSDFESKVKRVLFFKEDKPKPFAYSVTTCTADDSWTAEPFFEDPPIEELPPHDTPMPWLLVLLLILINLVETIKVLNTKLQITILENRRLKAEISSLKNSKYVENVLKDDDSVNFFTGLPSKAVFEKLHLFIASLVNRRWKGVKGAALNIRKFTKEPRRFGPQRKLSSRAEFLLTLMRLRLGLLGKDLASRFNISESLCSRIFHAWLRACSKVFGSMVFIPDEETLIATKPKKFRRIQDVHSIIDCTEIFIETPKDLELQCSSWSQYKHHNTIKLLVACAPNSSIIYISPAYTGRISDKALTLDCGYLDKIPPYSTIMADKGFNIADECAARNLSLYVPPGVRGQAQMPGAAVRKTMEIANTRIIIEQVIRRLKTFKIIQNELPISLVPHVNDILNVVGGICQTREPIYK